jgi:hypothetical protein
MGSANRCCQIFGGLPGNVFSFFSVPLRASNAGSPQEAESPAGQTLSSARALVEVSHRVQAAKQPRMGPSTLYNSPRKWLNVQGARTHRRRLLCCANHVLIPFENENPAQFVGLLGASVVADLN